MDDVRFTLQGNIAGFHSCNKRESWQMDTTEIAIIALQYDDIPDFGFNQTFIFITTTKKVFKIDISKIQEMAAFDLFWKILTARLQTDPLYQREFWPAETVVVYPRQLQGERLYED